MPKRSPGLLQFFRRSLYCVAALSVWLAAACGGRSMMDGADAGSSGATGVPGHGGRAGAAGGSTSAAGTGSSVAGAGMATAAGGATAAGAGGAAAGAGGAANNCASVRCPGIVCPSNTVPLLLPGNCCQTCETTCGAPCPACAVGFHPVRISNLCCPSCEPDVPANCERGRTDYGALREQLLEKYSAGCSLDQDCVAFAPTNLCETECDYYAIVGSEAGNWVTNLESRADTVCASCAPTMMRSCGQPVPAVCIDNVCRLP